MGDKENRHLTPREESMLKVLRQIAQRDCAGYCAMLARKEIERVAAHYLDERARTTKDALEVYQEIFGKYEGKE